MGATLLFSVACLPFESSLVLVAFIAIHVSLPVESVWHSAAYRIHFPNVLLPTLHPTPHLFFPLSQYQNPNPVPVLHILAVDPSHQRQGLGTKLIAPGLEAADTAGAKAYIEASPKGLPLYLKHGWVPVDEMVIDLTPYGGEGVARQKFLMREPGAGSV